MIDITKAKLDKLRVAGKIIRESAPIIDKAKEDNNKITKQLDEAIQLLKEQKETPVKNDSPLLALLWSIQKNQEQVITLLNTSKPEVKSEKKKWSFLVERDRDGRISGIKADEVN